MTALLERPAETAADLGPQMPPRNNVVAALTGLVVVGPVIALAGAVVHFWGNGVTLRDIVMAVVIYLIAGHGVTVGFHRLFTHRAFKANRPVKIALAVAGSFAFEGGIIAWVANHRCHHAHTDREGDPHSAGHGLRWREIDPTAWMVRALRPLRLAWNVVEITPQRQRRKLA
ncbi:MAG: acyl-CoA desaturase [Actinobacteria bacterium]|nr:acyl-CoA desaturase [Actinomycetota bacterium]